MPEFADVEEEGEHQNGSGPIPNLFPDKLVDLCLDKVLSMVKSTGAKVEGRALREATDNGENESGGIYPVHTCHAWPPGWQIGPNANKGAAPSDISETQIFLRSAKTCRDFLSTLLAGSVLDSLSESARVGHHPKSPGHLFTFSVLCGDRLGRLVLHMHQDLASSSCKAWAAFLSSSPGINLSLSCISECSSLNMLYMQHVATNELLYVVANTCRRLTLLDISYSHKVTDIGLVHLCGVLSGTSRTLQPAPVGCRYLRELYFNPQCQPAEEQIMPRVIACLLRHLPLLQVVDLANLHPGIEHYYRGTSNNGGDRLHHRASVKPLNLVHYTGSDRLAEVMDICPKLRTFKLFVTASLPDLGQTLSTLGHCLDQVTLVYPPQHTSLTGFTDFLVACGRKISRLDIESSTDAIIRTPDLTAIATSCPQLESLSFSNFHVVTEVDPRVSHSPVPLIPASFPFLSSIRCANTIIEQHGKDVFRYLVGGAHDLESIFVSFKHSGYFFSDFLLDDILAVNSLSHLTEFILKDGALTLISALRLISSRPKLRTVGRLLHWDVEPSELTTFVTILRKAKSLNLLQDITIV